jgi:hypothetical protein
MTGLPRLEGRLMNALPNDKCLHVIAGIFIFAITHFAGWQIGLVSVATAGLAKEVIDYCAGGDASVWDVVATLIGGLLGLLCMAG